MDFAVAVVTDVFHPSLGSDEGVVPLGVGGVVALHVGHLGAVFKLHHDHAVIFHVDDGGKSGLGEGGILSVVPLGASGGIGGAASAAVVDREHTHAHNALGVAAHEPVHHVDVMSALLEQKSVGVTLFRVPVTEIGVAAVADKVAAPAHLQFADKT